mmetsp:Transcript_13214/g.19922  ORF Transcript_13214/g.19922 Transcript_13214/m.19922 type:complete len:186 (+) Transcript_13214:17-574(+)
MSSATSKQLSESPLYVVKSIFMLDGEGKRIFAKYYANQEFPNKPKQQQFESKVWQKTRRFRSEILIFEEYMIAYRTVTDVTLCVIGDAQENEILLSSVLETFYDTCCCILETYQFDKRYILDNIDYVLLALDEHIDGGIIIESEPELIAERVRLHQSDDDIPLAEQTLTEALKTARDQIARSLLN